MLHLDDPPDRDAASDADAEEEADRDVEPDAPSVAAATPTHDHKRRMLADDVS
jgi:hypothetical protein